MLVSLHLVLCEQKGRFLPNFGCQFVHQPVLFSHPAFPLLDFLLFFVQPLFSPAQFETVLPLLFPEGHDFLGLGYFLANEHLLEQIQVPFVDIPTYWFHLLDLLDIFPDLLALLLEALQILFQSTLLCLETLLLLLEGRLI